MQGVLSKLHAELARAPTILRDHEDHDKVSLLAVPVGDGPPTLEIAIPGTMLSFSLFFFCQQLTQSDRHYNLFCQAHNCGQDKLFIMKFIARLLAVPMSKAT